MAATSCNSSSSARAPNESTAHRPIPLPLLGAPFRFVHHPKSSTNIPPAHLPSIPPPGTSWTFANSFDPNNSPTQPSDSATSVGFASPRFATPIINTSHPDISPDIQSEIFTPSSPLEHRSCGRPGISPETRLQNAGKILRDGKLRPADLLIHVLKVDTPKGYQFRKGICKTGGKMGQVLDVLMESHEGRECLQEWMRCGGLEVIGKIISDEMEIVKKSFSMKTADISPELINQWSLDSTIGTIARRDAPILTSVLMKAAQTETALAKNKLKQPNSLCYIIIAQLANSRSSHSLSFQAIFALFLWTTGCQRQTIDALFRCGLSVSFDSILTLVSNLGVRCIQLATVVARGPHSLAWDNINISTSIFVEQRTDAPAKVQSGTFAVIYKIPCTDPTKLLLAPIIARANTAPDLNFDLHIRPTMTQLQSTFFQMQIIVVRVLTSYSKHFESYATSLELQHKPRRPMVLEKTEMFPLRVTTINEATVPGTIQIWHNIYEEQLKRTQKEMENIAVPSFNDQLTNARIRGAKVMRVKDLNSFLHLDNIQLGYGLFHKCLNLVWALLKIHQGAIDQLGSLKYYFALLDKTRLSNDKPDYHTLLGALMQILHGIILQAWRAECGFSSLELFASSNPTSAQLLDISKQIILKYATPMEERFQPKKKRKTANALNQNGPNEDAPPAIVDDEPISESSEDEDHDPAPRIQSDDPQADRAHRNIRLLIRDLLYVSELVKSISDGDWGRIEDILGQLAMMFRGAGSNNYSTELLHFIRNLKLVWGQDFADIMRDCMLVNPSGLAGHWMGIDLNIEHLIGYLKALFNAKGLYASWDRLSNISAGIDYLNKIKKQVGVAMRGYRGSSHTTPNTADLVWKVAHNVREHDLLIFKTNRRAYPNDVARSVPNILEDGEKKLKSSSLKTFNNKIRALLRGQSVDEEGVSIFDEHDDISAPDFSTIVQDEEL